jgi:hypothetical protein
MSGGDGQVESELGGEVGIRETANTVRAEQATHTGG